MEKIKDKILSGLPALLFLFSGTGGLLSFFGLLPGIRCPMGKMYLTAAACCLFFWIMHTLAERYFWIPALLTAGGLGLAAWQRRDLFWTELWQAIAALQGAAGETGQSLAGQSVTGQSMIAQMDGLMIFSALLLAYLLSITELRLHLHGIWCLLTMGLLFSAPLLGLHIPTGSLLMLMLFQIGFWAIGVPARRKGLLLREKSGFISKTLIAGQNGLTAALTAAILFGAAGLVVFYYAEPLYQAAYSAEGFVRRSFQGASGSSEGPAHGLVSRGNNHRTGAPQLFITAGRRPSEPLYLKGFSGGDYIGGEWLPADDEPLFEQVTKDLNWGEWEGWVRGIYYSMYILMNQSSPTADRIIPLHIESLDGGPDTAYAPYYSLRWNWSQLDDDPTAGLDTSISYHYYEQSDLQIDWNAPAEDGVMRTDWFRSVRDFYQIEAGKVYTRVPLELLPRLEALVKANPLSDLDEITAFILYTLHSNTAYTLTPGWAPLNEDITEYFLFEGKKGYCVHYAAAAVLLYRMYGVPARYAAGYMAAPEDFTETEDGTWQAQLTDEAAHAWAEILLPEYGWTPIEVTPAADGSAAAVYPGFDRGTLEGLLSSRRWNMNEPSLSAERTGTSETAAASKAAAQNSLFPALKLGKNGKRTLYALLWSILLLTAFSLLFFLMRQKKRRAELERMGCRAVFAKLEELLRWSGALGKEEEPTAEVLAKAVPGLGEEEAQRLMAGLAAAAYGPEQDTAETDAAMLNCYRAAAAAIQQKLSPIKGLIFRYVKGF